MKRYTLSFAASLEHKPKHPERTARKNMTGLDFDVMFQVWPNRASMAKSIRLQERGTTINKWSACVPLRETEGY